MKNRLAAVLPAVMAGSFLAACTPSGGDQFCQTFEEQGGTAPDLGLYQPSSVEAAKEGLDHRIAVMDLSPPQDVAEEWETVRSFFTEKRAAMDEPNPRLVEVFLADDEVRAAMDVIQDFHIKACL